MNLEVLRFVWPSRLCFRLVSHLCLSFIDTQNNASSEPQSARHFYWHLQIMHTVSYIKGFKWTQPVPGYAREQVVLGLFFSTDARTVHAGSRAVLCDDTDTHGKSHLPPNPRFHRHKHTVTVTANAQHTDTIRRNHYEVQSEAVSSSLVGFTEMKPLFCVSTTRSATALHKTSLPNSATAAASLLGAKEGELTSYKCRQANTLLIIQISFFFSFFLFYEKKTTVSTLNQMESEHIYCGMCR